MCRGRVEGSDGGKQDDLRVGHVPDDRGSRQRSLLLRSARRIQLGTGTALHPTLPVYPRMSSHPSSRTTAQRPTRCCPVILNAAAVSGPDQDRMNAANLDTVQAACSSGRDVLQPQSRQSDERSCRTQGAGPGSQSRRPRRDLHRRPRNPIDHDGVHRTAGLHLRLCRRKPTGLRYQCGRSNSRVCGLEGRRGR